MAWIWNKHEETIDNLNSRINDMLNWIGHRKETKIAIISHSSFIGQMKDNAIGDEKNELKHCYPYKLLANYNNDGKFINFS